MAPTSGSGAPLLPANNSRNSVCDSKPPCAQPVRIALALSPAPSSFEVTKYCLAFPSSLTFEPKKGAFQGAESEISNVKHFVLCHTQMSQLNFCFRKENKYINERTPCSIGKVKENEKGCSDLT